MASSTGENNSLNSGLQHLDMSQVRPQAKMAISGIEQVMDVLLYGTLEVKQYLAAECDLIFECRICRALFRSLPNFIGHKRAYCTEKMKMQMLVDEPERVEDDCIDESKTKVREIERSVSQVSAKGSVPEERSSVKQETCSSPPLSESPLGESVVERNAASRGKTKAVSTSRVTGQARETDSTDLNGKLTYADVVDFVKKSCKLCGMQATERRHLVEHVRNNHADRLYFLQCPHCPCSFFITGNLTRHLRNAHQVDAKAADVTLVLPGMNTHAMSLIGAKKLAATQSQRETQQHRRGGRIRTTFTQKKRKKPTFSSNPSDNSPTTGGNARKVPQRRPAVDSNSLSEVKSTHLTKSKALLKVKKEGAVDDCISEEDDSMSLAAMAQGSKLSSTVVSDDVACESTGSRAVSSTKVPESSKGVHTKQAAAVKTRSRSQANSSRIAGKTYGTTDSSPQCAPPAAKVARIETTQSSGPNVTSAAATNYSDANSFQPTAVSSTLFNGTSRNSRKSNAALPAESSNPIGNLGATKSVALHGNGESSIGRVSTRRLSLSPSSASSPDAVLNFVCRRCSFSSLILSECVSHVTSEHAVKVDRRDFQPHIEVRRQIMTQGPSGPANGTGKIVTTVT